ncbi:MAG TPA: flagellar hook-basal body complex protein [Steroidobacteraceae bacterium]|nr:flagellar hook-basal body complex protein [Steroidobacteraceae bacterium]
MLDSMYIAAIGLQAQKEQLDAAANNLANINTTAFKRQSVDFAAILDRAPAGNAIEATDGGEARPARVLRFDSSAGKINATGRALDVAIAGPGFIEVALPGDKVGYSRAGSLQINPEGMLSLASGHVLKADIQVPSDATNVRILGDGSVSALLAGDEQPTVLGQIELAAFDNPESLVYRGEGIFTAAGEIEPRRARPGEDGVGELETQSLEASNVDMVDEMVSLLMMQRVYELNSRVAQVADEMMGMSNNLRRG